MDLYRTLFDFIDMRSFSNLWYWIVLAVVWSSTSHWVLGIPHDMIIRARREGGQAQEDLEDLARINAGRILAVVNASAIWLVALACFWLTILVVLGFYYWIEFAQAVFLIMCPMMVVVWLSVRCARRIEGGENAGAALFQLLNRQRLATQIIGMVAISVTAMWGMWQNFNLSVLR
ncbi:MAG: component of SufBCD complex [Tabrizicola sp.]|nr:component of SufBCD complex [Tabrizicola sp.]